MYDPRTMKKPATLTAFWPQYLTYAQANLKPRTVAEYTRLHDRLLAPKFAKRRLKSLTTGEIERWHLGLRKTGPVQANRALALLSAILRLAARWRVIPVNPVQGIQYAKEEGRRDYLTTEARQRFLAAVAEEPVVERAFLLTLYYTGARPGELKDARRAWWAGDVLDLPDSKVGARLIYLAEPARNALEALPDHAGGALFPGVNPTTLWRRVRRKAGLSGFRLYDLRHTFASAGLQAGMNLEEISQLLGHRNPRTTRRYAHLTTEAGVAGAARAAAVLQEG